VKVLKPNQKILYTTGYTRNAIMYNGTPDHGTELLYQALHDRGIGGESADHAESIAGIAAT